MRVTEATKQATRTRILEVSERLFRSQGFDETTTRDVAREAGIAAGTLFNYFASKELVLLQLVDDRLQRAEAAFERRRRKDSSLEEDLFLYIATGLRQLKPLRSYLGRIIETHLGPASRSSDPPLAEQIRSRHLERVSGLVTADRSHESQEAASRDTAAQPATEPPTEPPTALQLQMYWLLYTGVLSHWTHDDSSQQEDTLALLDQSMRMFVSWLTDNSGQELT